MRHTWWEHGRGRGGRRRGRGRCVGNALGDCRTPPVSAGDSAVTCHPPGSAPALVPRHQPCQGPDPPSPMTDHPRACPPPCRPVPSCPHPKGLPGLSLSNCKVGVAMSSPGQTGEGQPPAPPGSQPSWSQLSGAHHARPHHWPGAPPGLPCSSSAPPPGSTAVTSSRKPPMMSPQPTRTSVNSKGWEHLGSHHHLWREPH